MTLAGWSMILLFLVLIVALAKPAGNWLHALYARETMPLGFVERSFYRAAGIDPRAEQGWVAYAASLMVFNLGGVALLFAILKLQGGLPFNPQGFGGMETLLAFNTAASFVTNTNWQNYGGESALSNFSQMAGLTVQNFLSAAVGIAVAFAFIRGFARRQASGVGNFWVDVTRVTLYLLLPASIVLALVYVLLGVPQTFGASVVATTMEGAKQTIAVGPVASQLAIKMLGTNGGGFFNANSAHPFENPTAITNFIQMLSVFVLGAGLTLTFGKAVGNVRQGWAILAAMMILFVAGVAVTYWAEAAGNPIHHALGLAGGNMEGKEVRFGIAATALFAVVTTASSCGAVIGMHDSFTALGGLVPMFNMQLGELVIGGVGSGLYAVLIYAILAVLIAGLMVGRTPEYVGKKIEAREMKLAVIAIAIPPLAVLGLAAVASVTGAGLAAFARLCEVISAELVAAWARDMEKVRWKSEESAFLSLKALLPDTSIERHAMPSWLAPQHLDMLVPDANVAVEHQGEQHYRPIDMFGGEAGFAATVRRDENKRRLCQLARIGLEYIRHDEDAATRLKDIARRCAAEIAPRRV